MSITIELDLPEEVIRDARAFGLLETPRLATMLADELNRCRAGQDLRGMLDQLRSVPGSSQTMQDINAEIKAVRVERRSREARS